jgi:hypothetical protein
MRRRAAVDTKRRANMSISIPKSREDLNVLTISELTRKLDVPVSQMTKALGEGVVRPAGQIGHAAVVTLTDEEIESLRAHFHPLTSTPQKK